MLMRVKKLDRGGDFSSIFLPVHNLKNWGRCGNAELKIIVVVSATLQSPIVPTAAVKSCARRRSMLFFRRMKLATQAKAPMAKTPQICNFLVVGLGGVCRCCRRGRISMMMSTMVFHAAEKVKFAWYVDALTGFDCWVPDPGAWVACEEDDEDF